jgi:membrane protein involved in colicin uptake
VSDIDSMISRLTDRQRQEFAIACARRVQHLMTDPRSIAALDTRERWLRGKATNEEMTAALASARAAADAAWAAWAAADAAGDAKWTAERAWQIEELERMLGEGGGA